MEQILPLHEFLSNDGTAIVNTAYDFFIFPYDKINLNNPFAIFLRPEAPLIGVIFYIISKPVLKSICGLIGTTGSSSLMKLFVVLHNVILTIFSAVVMVNSFKIVIAKVSEHGLRAAYCHNDGTFWNDGIGFWTTVFYISKYYEFIDTYVLIIKRKHVSLLQFYHHAGIVFMMYGLTVSQCPSAFVAVCLNSFIHTIMYSYFTLSTFGYQSPLKRYLTQAQIVQFFAGVSLTIPVSLSLISDCSTQAQRFALFCTQCYVFLLILLFVSFYRKSYDKSKEKRH